METTLLLGEELKTYEREKQRLLGAYEGKFVVVRGEKVEGVFDSKEDAIKEGYARFGNVPFLVKQVLKVEVPQNFVSNLLAV